jgi:hypothetical protein
MNPLNDLCRQMGIQPDVAGKLAGLNSEVARRVMAADPPPDIEAYLNIATAVGVRHRIIPAPPLRLWFDAAYLDSLNFDNSFRQSQGLLRCPTTRGDLVDLVLELIEKHPAQPTAICKLLMESVIPTMQGLRDWARGTIPTFPRQNWNNLEFNLDMPGWQKPAWRKLVLDLIISKWCEHDPVAFVRYGFKIREEGEFLYIDSEGQMPQTPRQWILDSLQGVRWIVSRWGIRQ